MFTEAEKRVLVEAEKARREKLNKLMGIK